MAKRKKHSGKRHRSRRLRGTARTQDIKTAAIVAGSAVLSDLALTKAEGAEFVTSNQMLNGNVPYIGHALGWLGYIFLKGQMKNVALGMLAVTAPEAAAPLTSQLVQGMFPVQGRYQVRSTSHGQPRYRIAR